MAPTTAPAHTNVKMRIATARRPKPPSMDGSKPANITTMPNAQASSLSYGVGQDPPEPQPTLLMPGLPVWAHRVSALLRLPNLTTTFSLEDLALLTRRAP